MPADPPGPARRRFARRLTRLAEDAGLQGHISRERGASELGERIGRDRSAVYRMQTGATLPARKVVLAYLEACGVTDSAVRAEVLDELENAQTESRSWSAQARDGHMQDVVAARLANAGLVCSFQTTAIPGLLQTAAYATRLLETVAADIEGIDVSATVAGRIASQQLLHAPGRVFRFVVGERVLARDLGDPAGMAAQREHVHTLAALDRVEVLVLPEDVITFEIPFTIYDQPRDGAEPSVAIELPHADTTVTGEDVQTYRDLFARLAAAAAPLS